MGVPQFVKGHVVAGGRPLVGNLWLPIGERPGVAHHLLDG
jgi:hypothetical protein